jgi:hypothetical protein
MGKEDYLKVYRLTMHIRETGKKGATTVTYKDLSKSEANTILNSFKNKATYDVFKHHIRIA